MSTDKPQFELPLAARKYRPLQPSSPAPELVPRPRAPRLAGIDQVLSTKEVEQITGRHRCTIYRWVCAGTFPEKRAGGRGWLRSDVERWLIGARPTRVPGAAP